MDKSTVAEQIVASLKDRSIYNEELGMYWKGMLQGGYYWYNAPVETMALLIEAFDEVTNDEESVNKMRRWLLKNKQANDWKTTKATADASYALLLQGTDYLMTEPGVEIGFGKNGELPFVLPAKTEAGTGYFKTDFLRFRHQTANGKHCGYEEKRQAQVGEPCTGNILKIWIKSQNPKRPIRCRYPKNCLRKSRPTEGPNWKKLPLLPFWNLATELFPASFSVPTDRWST